MKKSLLTAVLLVLTVVFLALGISAVSVTDDASDTLTLGSCVIEGLDGVTIPSPTVGLVYELDSEKLTATVSGRGSFAGGELVFPSTVTYGGKTYEVVKINSNLFQKLTYDLYIPDSIKTIAGGSYVGTFGNSTLGKVYIGSGITEIERETFSGSNGLSVFVCKSKPTKIGVYAFNQVAAGSAGITEFEFDLSRLERVEEVAFSNATFMSYCTMYNNEALEYIGPSAFVSSKINGTIIISEDCVVSNRCFNGTSLDLVVFKGDSRELGQELFSGSSGGLTVAFEGEAVAVGDHVLSGNTMSIYMSSKERIQKLATSISKKANNGRLTFATFYSCTEGEKYTSTSGGVLSDGEKVTPHLYTQEAIHFDKNCSQYEREVYICYACGNESIKSQGTELGSHILTVTVKEASCISMGYIEHKCNVCDYEETVHLLSQDAHKGTVKSYSLKDNETVTVTTRCEFCYEITTVEDVSLVNKCYIEGYGLFDATTEYVSVSADGVATPKNGATFNNAVIYFPSYVEIDGQRVAVTTIKGFKALSVKSIYIPDTVIRIVGGSGVGCFGDISSLKNIVVGKGVTELEQEVFSMGNNVMVEEFIFKGTITSMKQLCLQKVSYANANIPYEFNTNLLYVGKQVNLNGNIIREARVAKGCDLSERFAFNNANGLLSIYIEGGDTAAEALDLGQEFASNTATTYYYIKGYVTVSGQAVLAGMNNTRIYMESVEAIDLFANAIKSQKYNDRINKAVFMDCQTGKAWFVSNSASRTESTVAFAHGVVSAVTAPTCQSNGTVETKCFVCGTVTETVSTPKLEHQFNSGVITKFPTKTENGIILYTCIYCDECEENTLYKALGTHSEIVVISYTNGFDKAGIAYITCKDCDHSEERHLEAIYEILGFSVREDRTGLTCGYKINPEAMAYYESVVGELRFGVIIANANDIVTENGLLNGDFALLDGIRGFMVDVPQRNISCLDVKLMGAVTDELRAFDFLISAYIISDMDGNGESEIEYLQHTLPQNNETININGQEFVTISIDRASPVE